MEESSVVPSAPTNVTYLRTGQTHWKEVRRASPTPRELYKMMYEAHISKEELLNLRIGEPRSSTKVVGYLKRRMDGAARRVASHKKHWVSLPRSSQSINPQSHTI